MRHILLLPVLCLVLGSIIFNSCSVKPKLEHSFTLIRLTRIDSVTEQNKGWTIASYLHADLNKDSIFFSSDKELALYEDPYVFPESPLAGFIKGFSKDSTIIKFIQRSKSMAAHKKKINGSLSVPRSYDRLPYVLVLNENSHQQIINFTDYESDYIIDYVIGYLRGLPSNKNLKPTATDINLEAVLIPLLSHSELATLTKVTTEDENQEVLKEIR